MEYADISVALVGYAPGTGLVVDSVWRCWRRWRRERTRAQAWRLISGSSADLADLLKDPAHVVAILETLKAARPAKPDGGE